MSKIDNATQIDWETGEIRWFDRERRFGFVIPDGRQDNVADTDGDVFLYWRELHKSGIREQDAVDGRRVKYTTRQPDKPGRCQSQVDKIQFVA